MEEIKLRLNNNGEGSFYVLDSQEQIAQLVVSVSGDELTAHHTEVFPKGEGKELGKRLMARMADYARENHLKVTALCPFVFGQFKRHPEIYSDIWNSPLE
ncbi:N-acetyltransferase [Flavihumibacter sp. R14]|nr:N-acetyltransferase [Flavihumibacter soli]